MVRSTPIVIDNPGGKRLVVIPFEEYERLRSLAEDTADAKAYDRAKRRLAAGEDEMIPATIAERLLDEESPVRVWRDYRGLTVKELAAAAGLSAAFVSQMETGKRRGSTGSLKAVAGALGISLDDLV